MMSRNKQIEEMLLLINFEAFGEGRSFHCLSPVLIVCFLFCFWAFKTNISVQLSLDFSMKKNVIWIQCSFLKWLEEKCSQTGHLEISP